MQFLAGIHGGRRRTRDADVSSSGAGLDSLLLETKTRALVSLDTVGRSGLAVGHGWAAKVLRGALGRLLERRGERRRTG